MRELGLHAYRFSVSWPRVMPVGRGFVDVRGLDFYDRLVDTLLQAGIAPWVTLYHWDLPQALEDEGGWPMRSTAEAFVEYTDVVSRRLGDRVEHWITHNEPWCASMLGYRDGVHAPGRRDLGDALAASHHMLLSHGWGVEIVRANVAGAQVGITLNLAPVQAASGSAADREARRYRDGNFNRWFIEPVSGLGYPEDMIRSYVAAGALSPRGLAVAHPRDLDIIAAPTDFLGVNYYYRDVVRSDAIPERDNDPVTVVAAPESEWTDMGWEVYPEGLWELLLRIDLAYAPAAIYVTENGASWDTGPTPEGAIPDARRVAYLRDHFAQAHRCIADGVPLRGYFVWSLLDNFEWQRGYTQRFGIVWVDYDTQERRLKDSALWYRRVIAGNAVRL
jgi:beta-glucosidase